MPQLLQQQRLEIFTRQLAEKRIQPIRQSGAGETGRSRSFVQGQAPKWERRLEPVFSGLAQKVHQALGGTTGQILFAISFQCFAGILQHRRRQCGFGGQVRQKIIRQVHGTVEGKSRMAVPGMGSGEVVSIFSRFRMACRHGRPNRDSNTKTANIP